MVADQRRCRRRRKHRLFRTGLTKAIFSSPRACLAQLRSPLRRKRIAGALPDGVRKQPLDPEAVTTSEALKLAADHMPHDPITVDLLALCELAGAIEKITPASTWPTSSRA